MNPPARHTLAHGARTAHHAPQAPLSLPPPRCSSHTCGDDQAMAARTRGRAQLSWRRQLPGPWWLLVCLWATSAAHAAVVGGRRSSGAPCVLPVYLVKDECAHLSGKTNDDGSPQGLTHRCFVWENRYLMDVVLGRLPELCGCHVELHDRPQAVPAMHALARKLQQQQRVGGSAAAERDAVLVLVARQGLSVLERRMVHNLSSYTRRALVVIHLGDEKAHRPHDVLWYPHVRAVFRNYHQDVRSLVRHISYLTRTLPDSEAPPPTATAAASGGESVGVALEAQQRDEALASPHVHWFPLGYGESFMTSPAWRGLPPASRPLLWSWAGSTHRKWERIEMVRQLSAAPGLLSRGALQELAGFKSPGMQSPMRYSDLLHRSALVPVPQGVACEQFRLYEALVAGAVPVVAEAHRHTCMAHVPLLGFKVLWVSTWTEARARMLELAEEEEGGGGGGGLRLADLAEWQAHNWARYQHVMDLVGQQFARATGCVGGGGGGGELESG